MKLGTLLRLKSHLGSMTLRNDLDQYARAPLFRESEIGILAQRREVNVNSTLRLVDFFVVTSSGEVGWIHAKHVQECS